MNKAILKRIEVLENAAVVREIPEMIMIHYDWQEQKFSICEMYCDKKTGRHIKNKVYLYDHYKDYEIPAAYDGIVIMDLIDVPEEYAGNLHSMNVDEARKELGVSDCGLKVEYIGQAESMHSKFNVTVVKRKGNS